MNEKELKESLELNEVRRPGITKLAARLASDCTEMTNDEFLAHVKHVYTSPQIVVKDGSRKRITTNPDYLARRYR